MRILAPLLAEYGFSCDAAGLRLLDRAVYAHMTDAPEVGARAKALAKLVMGDVWDEAA